MALLILLPPRPDPATPATVPHPVQPPSCPPPVLDVPALVGLVTTTGLQAFCIVAKHFTAFLPLCVLVQVLHRIGQ